MSIYYAERKKLNVGAPFDQRGGKIPFAAHCTEVGYADKPDLRRRG